MVWPQVLSDAVVVVMHSDICTLAPPGEKLAFVVGVRQLAVLDQNAVGAACAGAANPSAVNVIAEARRSIFVRFIFVPLRE